MAGRRSAPVPMSASAPTDPQATVRSVPAKATASGRAGLGPKVAGVRVAGRRSAPVPMSASAPTDPQATVRSVPAKATASGRVRLGPKAGGQAVAGTATSRFAPGATIVRVGVRPGATVRPAVPRAGRPAAVSRAARKAVPAAAGVAPVAVPVVARALRRAVVREN